MCIYSEMYVCVYIYIYIHTYIHICLYLYLSIYLYIYIYKLTSKCHSQTTPSSGGDSQGQETFLAPSAHKQTRNYDTECSNHHIYTKYTNIFRC